MRAVVTGGAGFLGRAVVERLASAAHEVVVVDRIAPRAALPAGARSVVCDVRSMSEVGAALDGADVLVHAAFAPPRTPAAEMRAVNVDALDALLHHAVAAGVEAVVLVSSTIVERPARRHSALERGRGRLEEYRRTRIEAETVAQQHADRLRVAIARPKTFVGPGQVGAFALLFSLVRSGDAVPILGPGTNRYQLVDVRDLADGLARLAEHPSGHGVYHFGAERFGTVADELQAVIDEAGTGARLVRVPARVGRTLVRGVELAGLTPLAEWHHCCAHGVDSTVEVTRARADLDWHPARSNREAIVDAYRSFASEPVSTTHPVPLSHRAFALAARAWR
jgi:nucleoside-diphosphate-sugar epimerase